MAMSQLSQIGEPHDERADRSPVPAPFSRTKRCICEPNLPAKRGGHGAEEFSAYRVRMAAQFFPYERDARWKTLLFPLGIDDDDGVTVDDAIVRATFGHWSVETPRSNVVGTRVTGPHRWYTAVGLRLSFTDDGLTFGTNNRRGLCIEFEQKIDRVIGFHDHSALWVSVADPEGLALALSRV
jgi:hypothetical protein